MRVRVLRLADGHLLDANDGTFKAAPSMPFSLMDEDGTRKGEYSLTENRQEWQDGEYTFAVRRQTGEAPAYTDPVVGFGEFSIKDDREVVLDVNPSTRLPENDARLDNLDAAVSTRLASVDYELPDNTGINAIRDAVTLLRKHATNRMTEADNGDGTKTFTYFDDDGITPVLTYSYRTAEKTREKAT
ncbi:MAG: hypothetical protein K8I01_09650 [Candidatus Methylomirabilis sp.]|nr:hypothetical protein [Deltaproteobacteria bacterium]